MLAGTRGWPKPKKLGENETKKCRYLDVVSERVIKLEQKVVIEASHLICA